jgi:hypothetical protein
MPGHTEQGECHLSSKRLVHTPTYPADPAINGKDVKMSYTATSLYSHLPVAMAYPSPYTVECALERNIVTQFDKTPLPTHVPLPMEQCEAAVNDCHIAKCSYDGAGHILPLDPVRQIHRDAELAAVIVFQKYTRGRVQRLAFKDYWATLFPPHGDKLPVDWRRRSFHSLYYKYYNSSVSHLIREKALRIKVANYRRCIRYALTNLAARRRCGLWIGWKLS